MALYYKWDGKKVFAYVLQFFSLISDSLGSVLYTQYESQCFRLALKNNRQNMSLKVKCCTVFFFEIYAQKWVKHIVLLKAALYNSRTVWFPLWLTPGRAVFDCLSYVCLANHNSI